jgi:hypothetical protein
MDVNERMSYELGHIHHAWEENRTRNFSKNCKCKLPFKIDIYGQPLITNGKLQIVFWGKLLAVRICALKLKDELAT